MSSPQRDQKRRLCRARSLPGKEQPGPASSSRSPGFCCLYLPGGPFIICVCMFIIGPGLESYLRSGSCALPSRSLILPCSHRGHPPSSCCSASAGLLETRAVTSACHVLCFNRCHTNRQGRGPLGTTPGTTALGN